MQSKADAFEYADQVLERWYPSVEEGNKKGIVVLVTSQKEGAVTGGPAFVGGGKVAWCSIDLKSKIKIL